MGKGLERKLDGALTGKMGEGAGGAQVMGERMWIQDWHRDAMDAGYVLSREEREIETELLAFMKKYRVIEVTR